MKITRNYIAVLFLALGISAFVGIQSPENAIADSHQFDIYSLLPYDAGLQLTRLETGIQAQMSICAKKPDGTSLGTGTALIKKGTTILQFENGVSVIAEQTIDLGGCSLVTAEFDSNSLESGLNSIGFVIDPDNVVYESDETNNSGTVKLFHPDAYPDIVIEHMEITPDPATTHGTGSGMNPALLTLRVRNVGGDMPRKTNYLLSLPGYHYLSSSYPNVFPPLDAGESYELSRVFYASQGFQAKPITVRVAVYDSLAIAYGSQSTGVPWWYYLQAPPSTFLPGQLMDVSAPAEIGTEEIYSFTLTPWFPGEAFFTSNNFASATNNFASTSFRTAKPSPYVLYPDDGKVFTIGSYPPLQSDWKTCVTCVPGSGGTGQLWDLEWKLEWIDSFLHFRWLPKNMGNVRLEIHDTVGNSNLVQDIYIDETDLTSSGDETPSLFPDRPGLHDDRISQYYLEERGLSAFNDFTFRQYDYDVSDLEPGQYRWRMKFDDPDAPDEVEPWSSWREFVVKKSELDLNNLTYLDHSGFFGDVTELTSATYQTTKFTTVTDAGDVRLWRTGQTVTSNLQASDQQLMEIGDRVAVLADRPPAVGKDLPDHVLAVAEQITVIPREPLRQHRKCVAVEKEGNTSTLTCDDGTAVELNNDKLNPGDSVVVLFHPKLPAQLVSTATELLERLTSMTNQASGQGDTELASQLDNMHQNTEKTFADKFSEIRDAASPSLKAAMDSMISSIKDLAGQAASGDTEAVISAETLVGVITNMEKMLDSMDDMKEIMVNRRLSRIPEEARDAVEATIRSETEEVIAQVKRDMQDTLKKLRDGEVENGITIMESTLFNMDRETSNSSVRTQVQSILDQLRKGKREITDVAIDCPSSTQTVKQIKCSFNASGKISSVTWSMPGASPDFIEQPNFTSDSPEKKVSIEFYAPGIYEVSVEACNEGGCAIAKTSVVVTESSQISTGQTDKAPEITLQCPSTAQTGKNVECAFQYSGKMENVTWSAPGGSPETGQNNAFVTQFETPGNFQISLTACFGSACNEVTGSVTITDNTTPTTTP